MLCRKLVISHRIIGTFEPQDILCILQLCSRWAGYPQSFGRIASEGFALVAARPIQTWSASFFQANYILLAWNTKRKGEVSQELVGVLCHLHIRKHELGGKGSLGSQVYLSACKEGIELLDVVEVVFQERQDVIAVNVERLHVTVRIDDTLHTIFYWMIQKTVTN